MILLDNAPISLDDASESPTVSEALETVKARLHGSGRMVLGLRCNDEEILVNDLDAVLNRHADEFDTVEFISGDPAAAVIDALRQTRTALGETFVGVRQAADALARGRVAESMEHLVGCLSVWSQVQDAVLRGGALVNLDFQRVTVEDRPMIHWLSDLTRVLRDLKGALESRDHVLLGDILQYELDETLRGWEQMLDAMIEAIRSSSQPAGAGAAP